MDTLSSTLKTAFTLLRFDLYEHLDEADRLAGECREWTEQDHETAGKLIEDLVVVIRGMLGAHKETAAVTCRACGTAWPCEVVRTVHDLVKDPETQFVKLVLAARDED
jgi:hypothetical protein